MPRTFPWSAFRATMADLAVRNERRCSKLYALIEPFDAFVGAVIRHPHGIDSERPQDCLACVLVVRSFRLAIGGLWLAASGYPELSPNLDRTIWEIGIRLVYSQKDPVTAALGFFIYAARREAESIEAELAHRRSRALDLEHFPENYQSVRSRQNWLESAAKARGIDVAKAVTTFGKLNIREACREIGIEKAYLVDYAFDSGYIHERNLATESFLSVSGSIGEYELGPTEGGPVCEATFDILKSFSLVAEGAARLLEDESVLTKAEKLRGRLIRAWRNQRGVQQGD